MNLTDLLSSGSRHKWVVDNIALASFLKENTQCTLLQGIRNYECIE